MDALRRSKASAGEAPNLPPHRGGLLSRSPTSVQFNLPVTEMRPFLRSKPPRPAKSKSGKERFSRVCPTPPANGGGVCGPPTPRGQAVRRRTRRHGNYPSSAAYSRVSPRRLVAPEELDAHGPEPEQHQRRADELGRVVVHEDQD